MSRRRRVWWLIALASVVACGVAICWHVLYPGRPFDAQTWLADAREDSGVRQQMADRLIAHRVLIGKTRSEVIEMLGEPPPTTYFNDSALAYRLGAERGFISIDSEWLVLQLGPGGRVSDAAIARD
jgi:hypothetical protein